MTLRPSEGVVFFDDVDSSEIRSDKRIPETFFYNVGNFTYGTLSLVNIYLSQGQIKGNNDYVPVSLLLSNFFGGLKSFVLLRLGFLILQ